MSASRPSGQQRTDAQSEPRDYALFGIAIYMAYAIGTFIYKFLEYQLADEDSSLYFARDENELFHAAESAFFSAEGTLLIALAIGLYYYFTRVSSEPPYKPAAIASVAGTLVVMVIFLVLMLVFEPDAADLSLGDEILGLVVSLVGAALTAALGPVLLEQIEEM